MKFIRPLAFALMLACPVLACCSFALLAGGWQAPVAIVLIGLAILSAGIYAATFGSRKDQAFPEI